MTAPAARRLRTGASRWDRLRWFLLVAWLFVAAGALAFGERPSSRETLDQDLRSGRVAEVTVVGGLPPQAVGMSTQEVHWRVGPVRRWFEVRQISAGTPVASGDVPISDREIGAELAQSHPDLRVVRDERPSSRATLADWLVPAWVSVLAAVSSVLALGLLIGGPEPWRATRWAWFWLLPCPVGMVAFLLLSGSTPLLDTPAERHRRLTGGWAFLLAGLLGGGILASR